MESPKACPFSKGQKSCIGRDCQLWQSMEVVDNTGSALIKEDCAHVLTFIATRSTAIRTIENSAALDKLATEVKGLSSAIYKGNAVLDLVESGKARISLVP